jgi:hypothetical protein
MGEDGGDRGGTLRDPLRQATFLVTDSVDTG